MPTTIQVLGGTTIGGSAILVSVNGVNILIDYGMDMDKSDRDSGVFAFPPIPEGIKIDFVCLTHAHMDHAAGIKELVSSYNPYFFASAPTMAFAEKLIRDTYRMKWYEQVTPNNRFKSAQPYVAYNVGKDCNATFYPNGHVKGSSSILLKTPDAKILVSGDLNDLDLPTVSGFKAEVIAEASPDILFMESTYGNQIFPSREAENRRLVAAVREVINPGGNVLIPSFAFGRSTDIALLLAKNGIHVNLDGMTIRMTRMMEQRDLLWGNDIRFDYSPYIHFVRDSSDVIRRKGQVVIASSGWCVGGKVMEYLLSWLPSSNNAVFFPGPFQKHLALELLKPETQEVLISYETRDHRGKKQPASELVFKRARVEKFWLSSHADQNGLVKFAMASGAKTIVLQHGDSPAKIALKARLEKEIPGITIKIAEENEIFTLTA